MSEQLAIPDASGYSDKCGKKSFKLGVGRRSKGNQNARENRSSNSPSFSQTGGLSVDSHGRSSLKRKLCRRVNPTPCLSKTKEMLQKKQKTANDDAEIPVKRQSQADFGVKNGSAEDLYLSGEPKLVTSVVKSPILLELNNIDNGFMNLWNSYIEKLIGKTKGICQLPQILTGFVNENKENLWKEDFFKDLMLHICSLEQLGLLSSKQGKNIVQTLVGSNDERRMVEINNITRETSHEVLSPGDIETPDNTNEAQGNISEESSNGGRDNSETSDDTVNPQVLSPGDHETSADTSDEQVNISEESSNGGRDNRETSDDAVNPQVLSPGDLEISDDTSEEQVKRSETECPQSSNGGRDNANYRLDLESVEIRVDIRMSSASFARIGHLLPSGLAVKLRPDKLKTSIMDR